MSKLIFEFSNDKIRDVFLGQFCDGGIEDIARESLAIEDISVTFYYKKAYRAWGWNGKGDPTIIVESDV